MNNLARYFLSITVAFGSVFISSALLADPPTEPLIYNPVFNCGSGSSTRVGDAGGFKPKSGAMPYTFDRTTETIFEGGQVKPVALSPNGKMLFVTNTPANCLEIYSVVDDKLQLISSVLVGVEPVSVAARTDEEVWVVNHISDSVSIVSWNNALHKAPRIIKTLHVGDEPRDIVFADDKSEDDTCDGDKDLALITTANRGQHSGFNPLDLFRDFVDENSNNSYDNGEDRIGRAAIWAFQADNIAAGHRIIPLFSMPARGLATTQDRCTVYAASLMSGNQTTVTSAANGFFFSPSARKDVLLGDKDRTANNLSSPDDNEVIVRYSDADNDPTNSNGQWIDGVVGEDWSDQVKMTPSDFDVFAIAANEIWASPAGSVTKAYRGVGTTLFNLAVHPSSGMIYVSSIEARNDKRYVGDATTANPVTLMGHFAEHNITVLSPTPSCSSPSIDQGGFDLCGIVGRRHLNDHLVEGPASNSNSFLGYVDTARRSMAQPTDMVISSDGYLYVANFGSRTVSKIPVSTLDTGGAINSAAQILSLDTLANVTSEGDGIVGGGPAGLAISGDNKRLYVYTRFDNALMILDIEGSAAKKDRIKMTSPESPTVVAGRPFLYDAQLTSNNGTGSCGSCHIYGDLDMLAWDLGLPSGDPIHNALTPSFADLTGGFLKNRVLRGRLPANTASVSIGELGNKSMVNADTSGTDYYNDEASFFNWLSPPIATLSRSSGVVTVTTKGPHPFTANQKIQLLNVNDNFKNAVNGNNEIIPFTIQSVSGNTFSYDSSGVDETINSLSETAYTLPAAPNGSYPIIEKIERKDNVVTVTTTRRSGYANNDSIQVQGVPGFSAGPHTISNVGGRSFTYSENGSDQVLSNSMMAAYGDITAENAADPAALYQAPDKYLAVNRAEFVVDTNNDLFSQSYRTTTPGEYLRFYPISGVSRVSGTTTVTLGATFNYLEIGQDVTISGVSDTSFNGTYPILAKTNTTITYDQTGQSLGDATSSGGEASALPDTIRAGDYVYLCHVSADEFRLSKNGSTMLGGGACNVQGAPYFVKWTSACGRGGEWTGFELSQCQGGFSEEINPDTATFIDWHPSQGGTPPSYKSTLAQWNAADKYARALLTGEREVFLSNGGSVSMTVYEGGTVVTGGIHDRDFVFAQANTFHPLKGPMTTQTLRGIADSGALHWRGDKSGGDGVMGGGNCPINPDTGFEDCTGSSSAPQELTAFKQFNEAFVGLLGKTPVASGKGLTDTQMGQYAQFVMRLTLPPNPIAKLDGTLPPSTGDVYGKPVSALAGNFQYMLPDGQAPLPAPNGEQIGATSLAGINCNSCHALNTTSNLFGTDKTATFETSEQFIKVPHLRNAYQKIGMFVVEDAADQQIPFGLVSDVFRPDGVGCNPDKNDENPCNSAFRISRPQVAGFGFNHNGAVDTLVNFFDLNFFQEIFLDGNNQPTTADMLRSHARNIALFVAAFDNNVPTVTGQQLTLRKEDFDTGPDDFISPATEEQYNLLLDKYLQGKCDLVAGIPEIDGTSTVMRAKGSDAVCGYDSGFEEKVCFDSQYDGPTYVPHATDGTARQVLFDVSHPIKEITFTCLPKGNEALLMRYINVDTQVTPVVRTNPQADTATWYFGTNPLDIRALWFGRSNDIDVAFPKDIQIWGSNSSGAVQGGDELLTSSRLKLPALNGFLDLEIPVRKSINGVGYQYYKLQVLSWYCEDPDLTCSSQSTASTISEPNVAWKMVSPVITPDDDQDGLSNISEIMLGSDRLDSDSDNDGLNDGLEVSLNSSPLDYDSDNDDWCDGNGLACEGLAGVSDAFPTDPTEWLDTDGDLLGNNSDLDDDGDCMVDASDSAPLVAASGFLDCTFSSDGAVSYGFVNGHDNAYASLIWNVDDDTANNGKLVVVGKIYNSATYGDIAVVRYNLDGTLDSTFDSDGFTTLAIGPQWEIGLAVAQQADGKLLVAGYRGSSSLDDAMVIARFNVDGSLDNGDSFDSTPADDFGVDADGVDGVVVVDNSSLDSATMAQANDILVQSDGKIVVVGLAQTQDPDGAGSLPAAQDGVVLRLNQDGTFDTTFSTDGIVVQKIGNYNDAFYSVVQQDTDKLVVGGRNGPDFTLARYNTDGTLDSSFGTSGTVTTNLGSGRTDYGYSLAEQLDNNVKKLVLVGVSGVISGSTWTDQDVGIVRYTPDGVVDSSYGSSGIEQVNIGSLLAVGWSVKVQADGKLVIGGQAGATATTRNLMALRINPDGGLDTAFGAGDDLDDVEGVATFDIGGGDDLGRSVEIISSPESVNDGKILLIGYGRNGTYDDMTVLRYHD